MKNYYDIALIMKKIVDLDGGIEYIPIQILEGTYDEDNNTFIDLDGTPYIHIIENPETIGFLYRDNILNYKKNYPHLNSFFIKKLMFRTVKKYMYKYCFLKREDKLIPAIMHSKINGQEGLNLLLDNEILQFYVEEYPEIITEIFKDSFEDAEKKDENSKATTPNINKQVEAAMDIAKMYQELTAHVIDQDEPIRKILTAIWKQYSNFSSEKSRNILINGSTGVGKTETFRRLVKMLDIPYFMTSATEYTAAGYIGKSVEDMLIGLLKNANYDLEKAQKGILIIDEIDKLSESNKGHSQINQRDVQEALLKILEDGTFNLNVNGKEYAFNTSKIMVIGMGSWSRIELKETTPIGFGQKTIKKEYKDITREDIVAAGMIPELIGRFPVIVQMNELDLDSFIRILKTEGNTLSLNRTFLNNNGVNLVIDDEVLKTIALRAAKQKYGARSLDEIVETALAAASFEIASNPNLYEQLIITPETIEDNKKYTLIRKRES